MPYAGPTEIHIKGEDWVRDGSWFVKKSIVDKYGSVDAAPPAEVEANRVSYPDGVSTQTVEQRAAAQGAPAGSNDQFYAYRNGIGEQEFKRRSDLAGRLGVNRSTDTSPKGVLADELFYGHMDELPGTGLYFNMGADGRPRIKDQNGNEVTATPELMQSAQAAVKQGYGTGQSHSQAGTPGTTPPAGGPPSPPSGNAATKVVNGVTYQQQPDGTWLKQDKPATDPSTSPANPAATVTPQMSSMVGTQQAGLANLQAQPADFWKQPGGRQAGANDMAASPATPQANAPSLIKPLKMPVPRQPMMSNSLGGAVKQPNFGRMGGMKPPGLAGGSIANLPPVLA